MIRYIRRAAAFCLLLLVALLLNAARVQVFEAPSLDDNAANRRNTIDRYDQPRGNILADGKPVTGSKDTGEQLAYERTYRRGPLYAPVTGYASQTYGTTLIENAEDDILSGADPMLAPLPFWNEVTRSRQPGGDVATTVKDSMQRAAYEGSAVSGAPSRPSSRRPARSWPWSRRPRTTPGGSPAPVRPSPTPGGSSTRTPVSRCSTGPSGRPIRPAPPSRS